MVQPSPRGKFGLLISVFGILGAGSGWFLASAWKPGGYDLAEGCAIMMFTPIGALAGAAIGWGAGVVRKKYPPGGDFDVLVLFVGGVLISALVLVLSLTIHDKCRRCGATGEVWFWESGSVVTVNEWHYPKGEELDTLLAAKTRIGVCNCCGGSGRASVLNLLRFEAKTPTPAEVQARPIKEFLSGKKGATFDRPGH